MFIFKSKTFIRKLWNKVKLVFVGLPASALRQAQDERESKTCPAVPVEALAKTGARDRRGFCKKPGWAVPRDEAPKTKQTLSAN